MNDTDKISRAIRACIRECFGSNAVPARVARFLDDLRTKPGWKDSEVRLVERGVRRILTAIVDGNEAHADVTIRRSA